MHNIIIQLDLCGFFSYAVMLFQDISFPDSGYVIFYTWM